MRVLLCALALVATNAGTSMETTESALAVFEKSMGSAMLNATKDDPAHTLCAPGKYRSTIELPCRDCPTGYFQNLVGAGPEIEEKDLRSACKKCVHGFYQNELGHESCKECPDGFSNSGLEEEDEWLDFGYDVHNNAVRDGDMAANPGNKLGDVISNVTLDECKAECNSDGACNNFAYSFFTRDCQKYDRCLNEEEPSAARIMTTLKGCTCKATWQANGKTFKGCSHLNTESGYRKMCHTTDNCNYLANKNEAGAFFDYCSQDPVWITYHRDCKLAGVKRCTKDCQGFKQTGKCGNETDLVMEPTWDIADSKDTCSVTIDKTRKGYCQCYGYDEDGRKGGNLITRNVGYSNCEENQPFTNCNELCNLHYTSMWRATENCDPNGERNRMYDLQGEEEIDRYKSGYCQCDNIWTGTQENIMKSTCDPGDKSYKTCKEACDDFWAGRYKGPDEAGP